MNEAALKAVDRVRALLNECLDGAEPILALRLVNILDQFEDDSAAETEDMHRRCFEAIHV